MSIQRDIPELLQADIISQETADKIHDYYEINWDTLTTGFL